MTADGQTPDLIVRLPYWLSAADRTSLAAAVDGVLSTGEVHPNLAVHLHAVLTELGVVAARDALWPDKSALVRQATGYAADVLPVRMSHDEIAAVLTVPGLSEGTCRALADAGKIRE